MAGTIVARGLARGGQGQIVAHGLGSGEAIVIEETNLYLSSSGAYPAHPVAGAVSPGVSMVGAGGLTVVVGAGLTATGLVRAGVRPAKPTVAGVRLGVSPSPVPDLPGGISSGVASDSATAKATGDQLLLESGDAQLLESGDDFLLE